MEKLAYKREKFLRTVAALERSINLFFRADIASDIKESLVASNIKHFEMCYEAACKFLQSYLKHKYDKEIASAKPIFRECFALGLIDGDVTKKLLDMCEARNATVHEYDEETAIEMCKRLQGYCATLKTLMILP